MNYIEYRFSISPVEPWREILMALLAEVEFESFVDTENGMDAYVKADLEDEKSILEQIQSISEAKIEFERKEIEQENWNAQWESNFQPIMVKDQCYIRAEFHEPKPEIPFEIIIQPKMSFGTGHHETTHLMVEFILETDFTGKDTLDMGCGTSILAILAKMKGAAYTEGIDIDEWSVENSIENAARNQVEMTVKLGDAEILGYRNFDVIMANIQRNILMDDIPKYIKVLNFGGELLLSGLMEHDFEDIKKKCEENGLNFVSKKQRNEWIALKFIKN
ncbi:50S ribosomal protein L11 methyltransferase [Moheibacter lacus]|uniref:Ribosomal protein L11 methyltransferase n=1 Tax=Moheibacter lacus TaxID=2745851 RepID=A0A838ZTL3_9FLAO|nr:50S ribosomal protein L11 methyltransferase [Moheibacter lacus]MBA5630279.1 50S ribosomal protein L11 methyltransferase [Moheibacter lacus]